MDPAGLWTPIKKGREGGGGFMERKGYFKKLCTVPWTLCGDLGFHELPVGYQKIEWQAVEQVLMCGRAYKFWQEVWLS